MEGDTKEYPTREHSRTASSVLATNVGVLKAFVLDLGGVLDGAMICEVGVLKKMAREDRRGKREGQGEGVGGGGGKV